MLFGGSVQTVDDPVAKEIAPGVWCNSQSDVQAVFQDMLTKGKPVEDALKARGDSCIHAVIAMVPGNQVGAFTAGGATFGVYEITAYGIYDEATNTWKEGAPLHVFGAHPIAAPASIES